RYLLSLGDISHDTIRMLVLQNDGVLFDEDGNPSFANEQNARTLATLTTWITGPKRVTTHVDFDTSTGHKQRLDGFVVGTIITNWQLAVWKRENPQIGGKIKFIPIPAFEPGGRRTTTIGSTMISINKRSAHIETAWEMAKNLYTSIEVAEYLYRVAGMITPLKGNWDAPFYHEPDPFCGGQQTGTLFIEQIPHMPQSPASPYQNLAYAELVSAMIALRAHAEQYSIYEVEPLAVEALRVLKKSQNALQKLVDRNVFIGES
ncbi:extracellular solute-binding protein, partial [Cephaloticoccus capnophilus]|uniref:extracellular solute-binding protein n=1 Tax=Cephaloticoccus capnophilus TaxID=1548208 RepID=UPI0012E7E021